jgi:hypothetical protein
VSSQAFCVCGQALNEPDNLPYEDRTPCPICGGRGRAHPGAAKFEASESLIADSTQIHVLDTAGKYYSEILKPEHEQFLAHPATLRSAFNLARNLFHFRDWLFDGHRAELGAERLKREVANGGAYLFVLLYRFRGHRLEHLVRIDR